jgi:hypothetical protein
MRFVPTARASGLAPFSHKDTHIDRACLLSPVPKMLDISKRAGNDEAVSINNDITIYKGIIRTIQRFLCL